MEVGITRMSDMGVAEQYFQMEIFTWAATFVGNDTVWEYTVTRTGMDPDMVATGSMD